jgi:hypothetical protein
MYFQKMEILPDRNQLFMSQVSTNEEFGIWMKEMNEGDTVDLFNLREEWEAFVRLIRAIEESQMSPGS